MMKAMQDDGLGLGEDCRPLARSAMVEIIEDSLAACVDVYLLNAADRGDVDRRNGTYRRRILTELGDIELELGTSFCAGHSHLLNSAGAVMRRDPISNMMRHVQWI